MKTLITVISTVVVLCSQNSLCDADQFAEEGHTTFKCKSEKGSYTYQKIPCPEKSATSNSWVWNVQQDPHFQANNSQQKILPSFSIQRSSQGGYMTQGAVNSVPVIFQVDTGADYVSISQAVANRAGMVCIKRGFAETANGTSTQCESKIVELTFGSFKIQNVKAFIMPNLKGALMGMNVISMFHVEHADGVMKITYKH